MNWMKPTVFAAAIIALAASAATPARATQAQPLLSGTWTFTTNVIAPTCDFRTSQTTMTLPRVEANDLRAAHVDQMVSASNTASVIVDQCQNAASIEVAFAGTSDASTPTLFKNTAASPATGVGVYLQDKDTGTRVAANGNGGQPTIVKPVAGTGGAAGATFNLVAGYARTGAGSVGPGDVQTAIDFQLTYK
ncbi:fimbrial protein [Luteibacter jiangsuensis]|uniref:Fimbrial protein n=1 Tax=Luteibacter jiangsuensis TaxID=637577 RepID=A0ABX0Q413_9GAMM|nr:fimbrial protein [Luteibacter jiangsuensis]NID04694.1 fimbrial protein [Luteibacter jiangsuensis]